MPSKPASKAAKPKPAAKAPAKPQAAAKGAAKPAAPTKPSGAGVPKPGSAKAAKPTALSAMAPAAGAAKTAEPEAPSPKLEKLAEGVLCQIEVLKDGHFFIARTQTESGQTKEYKNTVFEDLLTEMLITLQEQLAD